MSGEDVREGLTAVISVKVREPQFEGQTKTKLGNSEVKGIVDNIVSDGLKEFFEEHPSEAKAIINKTISASRARQAARRAREVWFLADDTKFGSIYPAVIAGLQDGSILTNRCPDPRYRQQTLVKEAEV